MEALTELIKALAALAWPALTFYIFWSLRTEFAKLIGRIRRGKILGQELELDQQLDQLTVAVEAARQELPVSPSEPEKASALAAREVVLGDGSPSPLATFLRVARALERAATNVLERTGWAPGMKKLSVIQAFRLMPPGWVGDEVMESIVLFSRIRNRIVHGDDVVSDHEVLRATELGFELLDVIRNYHIEENRVRDMVTIYSDVGATIEMPGVKGIRLNSVHPDKLLPEIRIYPTRKDWFTPGGLVSWEWDLSHVWGKAWFRDPDDGQIKEAWHSAGEFVGRMLEEPELQGRPPLS